MASWTTLLAGAVSLAGLLLQWWLSRGPAATAREARDENVRIHNEVAGHDVSAVRARLGRLRAQRP